jgi:succinyl-CoA synthetase beta subunit
MIESLRGAQIITGARGQKRADIESAAEALIRISQLLIDFPEIKEVDINPLRVFHKPDGCLALDARILL